MLDDIKKRKMAIKNKKDSYGQEKGPSQEEAKVPVVDWIGQANNAVDKALKAHSGETDMPLQMPAKKPLPKFVPVDSQKQFLEGLGAKPKPTAPPVEESKANRKAKDQDYDDYIQELYQCLDKQDAQDKHSTPKK